MRKRSPVTCNVRAGESLASLGSHFFFFVQTLGCASVFLRACVCESVCFYHARVVFEAPLPLCSFPSRRIASGYGEIQDDGEAIWSRVGEGRACDACALCVSCVRALSACGVCVSESVFGI